MLCGVLYPVVLYNIQVCFFVPDLVQDRDDDYWWVACRRVALVGSMAGWPRQEVYEDEEGKASGCDDFEPASS